MKNVIKNLGKALLKNEQGYGTVELLIIIGALGLLATGILKSLNTKLVNDGTGTAATDKVSENINSIINGWTTTP